MIRVMALPHLLDSTSWQPFFSSSIKGAEQGRSRYAPRPACRQCDPVVAFRLRRRPVTSDFLRAPGPGAKELQALLGTYDSGVLRLRIDLLNDRLRVRVFRDDRLLGASLLTPFSETRFRFDHFAGLHATFEAEDSGLKAILSNGETLRRIEEPD